MYLDTWQIQNATNIDESDELREDTDLADTQHSLILSAVSIDQNRVHNLEAETEDPVQVAQTTNILGRFFVHSLHLATK